MGTLTAFGVGVLLGAVAAFPAGRKFDRAHRAARVAAEYVGEARFRAGGAAGSVALFAGFLVVGALFVWAGR